MLKIYHKLYFQWSALHFRLFCFFIYIFLKHSGFQGPPCLTVVIHLTRDTFQEMHKLKLEEIQ